MSKEMGAATALVGKAVGLAIGWGVGVWVGQYHMLEVAGCTEEVGKGVVETEGGGLMKGGT
jgi:hypothetical protein